MAKILPTAPINISTTARTAIVPGSPGSRISAVKFLLVAAGSVTVQFDSVSPAGVATLLAGPMTLAAAGSGLVSVYDGLAIFATNPGDSLSITLGGNVQVSGVLSYDQSLI